jgi:Uncharacterized protein conserved in bacteria (DUF2255)
VRQCRLVDPNRVRRCRRSPNRFQVGDEIPCDIAGDREIRADGLERDLSFAEPVPSVHGDIDAAYHAKYDRYKPEIVGTVVGREAEEATIRLMPRSSEE